MHIILTHEQADFDALASLLGASLLYETAIPVLPRRMNRNLHAFLTIYEVELPFIDPRDLNGEPIEEVTLVDTQAAVSIKGMGPETRYRVIDHHPLRENLPPDWAVSIEDLGATTTLLVEALQEQDYEFTTIQATLLLLGIYEDTGSLTYTRTQSRDLRAAAYLLEQGANLQIASTFLNHPLSQAQQALYDRLRVNAESLPIHGHNIIVASSEAQEIDEELSSVVHRLRDLLDPDALFVLVTTRGGVQLIARSSNDNIDVAEIAARLGGGGHERAAAALIRGRSIDDVRAELVNILPGMVRPAITVSQIMSRGPQVLSADTPVEEAAQRMQRYGYEGYPVVQTEHNRVDGLPSHQTRVIGLLTRRAVDRALGHKLPSNASQLMEAGEVTIKPNDSIETLQRLMTETGWGQIPVVHPDSGEIIGIVTRTDLLKTLAPRRPLPSRLNLAERLEAALPGERVALLKAIAQVAHEQHAALYIVGGFVRDLMLDQPSLDFDLVVEGDGIALAHAMARKFGGRVTSHNQFGTAKWLLDEHWRQQVEAQPVKRNGQKNISTQADACEVIDFITARTEFYTYPSALPTVERGSIKLDLHRRDFTINTLALRLDGHHYGELQDYWGGLSDLQHRLVRVLHSLSFVDDPTRMLRAVRFEKRFNFQIETRTLELLKEAISLLDRVSGDRIRHELDHVLSEMRAPQMLARLDELHLLAAIHPALKWDTWLQTRLEALLDKEPDMDWGLNENKVHTKRSLAYIIWLLRLSPDQIQQVTSRLKFSAALKRVVLEASKLWNDLPHLAEATPSIASARLESVSPLARYAVYRATSDIHLRKVLQTYVTYWQKISSTINGDHLRARGLRPGPAYRQILGALRAAWLDGAIHNQEEEDKFLEELLAREEGTAG